MTSDTYQEPVTITLTEEQLAEIEDTANCAVATLNCQNLTAFNNLLTYCAAQHIYSPPLTPSACTTLGVYGSGTLKKGENL
ncbi:MAG: hypothetical protein LBS90_06285 [Oscillospiraceae bacterium]|jgi:hypothetical protein|nr:hypothetical protein [Oscillospiraceae bacterium]